jgi:hypothetical protein
MTAPARLSLDQCDDALRLSEAGQVIGKGKRLTHRTMHVMGLPHYHFNGDHDESDMRPRYDARVPREGLREWLRGRGT